MKLLEVLESKPSHMKRLALPQVKDIVFRWSAPTCKVLIISIFETNYIKLINYIKL